ncbi:MAG TPA: 2-dehydropantoate 2-reductase [Myxococcaceae bacterium]|nr:2-dehydropantoate 2-reductase [Myxococcaceae bacterium]
MKICVVGAGAIGGLVAAKLAAIGQEVSVVVRGPHLAAIREKGLCLQEGGSERSYRVSATDKMSELGIQELVVIGLKAHQVPGVAGEINGLCGPSTVVVTAQNGIPWWYFYKTGGPHEGAVLESVDPGGVIAKNIDVDRVLGSIIYPAADIVAPGVIRHVEGDRISLGEVDNSDTERLRSTAKLFRDAGFKVRVSSDLRSELWVKLWGNCTFNPISALTHATLVDLIQFPPTRALVERMMREAQEIGEKLGVRFPVTLDKRIAGAEAVGKHKTSMLQDVETGRPLELDALVGSVLELGRITGVPTPNLTAVHACVALLAKTLQDEKGRLRIEPLR